MINIKYINIGRFLNGFNILNRTEKIGFYKLAELDITEKDRSIINLSIQLRNEVNEVRGVNSIKKFQRNNPSQIDLKGAIGEYMFSKLLLNIVKNKKEENIEVKTPAIAEMILDKSRQDFELIQYYPNGLKDEIMDYHTFDVKSQFLNNKYNNLNVNIESFKRMQEQSKFFIYAEIDGNQEDFSTNKKVTFYYIKNSWYDLKSSNVLESNSEYFTPYKKLPLNYLH